MTDQIEAIVGKICSFGKGSFAVFYQCATGEGGSHPLPLEESITFSLESWSQRECPPEVGQVVILGEVRKFARGWRAKLARPVVL